MAVALKHRTDGDRKRPDPDGPLRPVDLVHLARYTMGDRELEHAVLTLFMRQSEIYLDRLREAGDTRGWREAAHTLKGSARGIGAWRVAEAAEEAEGQGSAAERARCVRVLADRVAEANGFIRDLLAEG